MEFQFKLPERKLWREKVIAELKENSDRIFYKNEIEEIEFDITDKSIKTFEYIDSRPSNEWKNCFKIIVTNEKVANKRCLNALNQGADSLFFEINGKKTNWPILFDGIKFEYIQTKILIIDKNERISFKKFAQENGLSNIDLVHDPLVHILGEDVSDVFLLNGFEIQQIGANSWQEIGLVLSTFHELLLADFSSSKFNVHLGVGSNYFIEIAKFRAVKWLMEYICNQYQIQPEISYSAEIGFTNKSLKDPHTNILRQTTEAMAAISGGVSEVTIRPCDDLSMNGSTDFSRKVALNISNILKEESYFDYVKDPLKGSQLIELLTEQIIFKAWHHLKTLGKFESINGREKIDFIQKSISETSNKRSENFKQKKSELIGINSYLNMNEEVNSWASLPKYLEIPYLIFENLK
jgi:methylmalonyl-CoA mutase